MTTIFVLSAMITVLVMVYFVLRKGLSEKAGEATEATEPYVPWAESLNDRLSPYTMEDDNVVPIKGYSMAVPSKHARIRTRNSR